MGEEVVGVGRERDVGGAALQGGGFFLRFEIEKWNC